MVVLGRQTIGTLNNNSCYTESKSRNVIVGPLPRAIQQQKREPATLTRNGAVCLVADIWIVTVMYDTLMDDAGPDSHTTGATLQST